MSVDTRQKQRRVKVAKTFCYGGFAAFNSVLMYAGNDGTFQCRRTATTDRRGE